MCAKTINVKHAPYQQWLEDIATELESQVISNSQTSASINIHNHFASGIMEAGVLDYSFLHSNAPLWFVKWNLTTYKELQFKSVVDQKNKYCILFFYITQQSEKLKTPKENYKVLVYSSKNANDLLVPPHTAAQSLSVTFSKSCLLDSSNSNPNHIIELLDNSSKPIEIMDVTQLPIWPTFKEAVHNRIDSFLQQMAFRGQILGLIRDVFDHLMNKKSTSKVRLKEQDLEALVRAEKLLLKDLTKAPSIQFLANEAAMSTTKFKSLFRKVYGKSVYDYFLYQRMEQARVLLLENKMGVIGIAKQLGYHNLGYFSRTFKKHFGVLPSKYR
jgi:AraC-like DNA-binding protein